MHLTEGTLSATTVIMTSGTGLCAFGAACWGVRKELSSQRILSWSAMTVFVFAAQMLNCATGFGYSGHLLGGALLAIVFGPFSAMLSLSVVLSAQVLLLGDGDWGTLGANFLSMGVVAPWLAVLSMRLFRALRESNSFVNQLGALAIASFSSVLGAAFAVGVFTQASALELVQAHVIVGLLEAMMSLGIFAICAPDAWARLKPVRELALKPTLALCLFVVLAIPFSSDQPDAMEYVLHGSDEIVAE